MSLKRTLAAVLLGIAAGVASVAFVFAICGYMVQ